MKFNFLRGLVLAFAGLLLGVSTPSWAQSPEETPTSAEKFFGVTHLVPGLPLTLANYQQLKKGEPVIFSTFNSIEIQNVAAKHGWGSEKVRKYVDKRLSKEGNSFRTLTLMGGYILDVVRTKGVDVDQNCTTISGYVIADDSDGAPVFTHSSCVENWGSIWGKAMASMASGIGTNLVAAASNQGFAKLFETTCKGSCRNGGNIFNVSASASGGEGGDAYAEGGDAGAQASSTLNQSGTGGTCPSGTTGSTCQLPNPNPH